MIHHTKLNIAAVGLSLALGLFAALAHAQSTPSGLWKTIDDDYHWHIEILPVLGSKARSYTFKEVYYSPISSETGVKRLREAKIDG